MIWANHYPNQNDTEADSRAGKRQNSKFKSIEVLSYFKHFKINPRTSPRVTPKKDFLKKKNSFIIKYKSKEGVKDHKKTNSN